MVDRAVIPRRRFTIFTDQGYQWHVESGRYRLQGRETRVTAAALLQAGDGRVAEAGPGGQLWLRQTSPTA